MASHEQDETRSGFVAVIGAPNAGKSTLMNALVGAKVSIVTHKVQTTRALVRGIAQHNNSQIVFIDTPGIFSPKKPLEKAMVNAAWEGQAEADMIMLVMDAAKGLNRENAAIIERLASGHEQKEKRPVILVLNKIDKIRPEKLLELTQACHEKFPFDATFMISALKRNGLDDLLAYLADRMPEGPWLYPDDQVSDMPLRLLAAEITREKLFLRLHQELPYALTVETENWEEFNDGSVRIDQIIYVARDSHRQIVLGKGGAQIKAIGQQARTELEEIIGCRVHLKLFVKVRERWAEDPERYRIWGLDYQS